MNKQITSVLWTAVPCFLVLCWLASAAETPQPTGYAAQDSSVADNNIIVKFRQPAADALEKQLNARTSSGQLRLSKSLDTLNAGFKAKTIEPLFKNFKENRRWLNALQAKNYGLLTENERHILRRLKRAPKGLQVPALDRIYKIQINPDKRQSLRDAINAYSRSPDVEYAEPDYIVSICKTPDDPLYPIQWPLNNIGQMYPESARFNHPPGIPDSDIDAPQAWDLSTGDSRIIVAVIDTGVDYTHRDLDDNMWVNEAELNGTPGIDDDGNGYIDDIYGYDFFNKDADPKDDHGHGTHCAGIIAAEGNNGLDIAGLCWNAKIMALKFLDRNGSGSVTNAVAAFYYAVENGADVTSNSWGSPFYSETLKQATDYVHSQGVVIVAAAGNNGNTDHFYPGYYDYVISVAATNSNDQRAPFSTYGDWVDIAAPGVDILSLRAAGTSMGTLYDTYTTIASGTSMACPHVAGACALALSIRPEMDPNEVERCLTQSADPTTPGTCASGRLNIFNAIPRILSPRGKIVLDKDVYLCSDPVEIRLFDSDLKGNNSQQVTLETDAGDSETVLLTETSVPGIFSAAIPTASGLPIPQDGTLQSSNGRIITVTYYDANDGTGSPAVVTDTALFNCLPPVVSNLTIDPCGPEPIITFETDEPAKTSLFCGTACDAYFIEKTDILLKTHHVINMAGVSPVSRYYFIIKASDIVGNQTVDDNDGQCYTFTTYGSLNIYVPSRYSTIQKAIDNSWNGGTVWVADGIYTGDGNRDIDFHGKDITVRSETGPKNCIIDCNGTKENPHRGFYFHSGEDANSVVAGFTITNGYAYGSSGEDKSGGAFYCIKSSPAITNCIITRNLAAQDGGGMHNERSSPILTNCAFIENSAVGNDAGAINNHISSPVISNCIFSKNSSYDWAGAIRNLYRSNPTITNCTFIENSAGGKGGAVFNYEYTGPVFTNCAFIANSSIKGDGGALHNERANVTVAGCTFASNSAPNGNTLACDSTGQTRPSSVQISNCILWNDGNEIWNNDNSAVNITYSNIRDGWSGQGNINADPCFVRLGRWANANDHNVPAEPNDPNAVWINGNYHLLGSSPCINAGDPNYVPEPGETDLDGRPRVLLGRIDMGAYEFNHIPVADAGPNQTVYADSNCIAEVTLDGSASYDPDGDKLTYIWKLDGRILASSGSDDIVNFADFAALAERWSDSEESFGNLSNLTNAWLSTPNSPNWNSHCDIASGSSGGPVVTVNLPVGEHHIELIVNDGLDDSEPNEVIITVVPPLKSHLMVVPSVINRQARLPNIMAFISLPAGIAKRDVDLSKPILLYPGGIESVHKSLMQYNVRGVPHTVISASFDKDELMSAVGNGKVKLRVVGRLKTGQYFYGDDDVTVIGHRRRFWR